VKARAGLFVWLSPRRSNDDLLPAEARRLSEGERLEDIAGSRIASCRSTIMGIVRFALRLPHTFYVLAALVLFLGTTAILSMPTDIFPEIDIPVVTVIWQYTGLSTPEIEQRVTTYSEYSLSSSVNGIRDIEAQTLNGISVQKVFFQPDVNLDLAIAQIVSGTNSIRALMPAGIQAPVVVQYNASSANLSHY
jgi:multidrug efflux pump subunit AcrB